MLKMDYANLTWPEIKQAREEDYILLLPVGSIEEHGPHLPVGTDDFFAQRWANESAKMAREDFGVKTIVLPSIHYGDSLTLSSFPGTLSIRPETLINVVFDVADAVLAQGFKKIVIVNVHGGNRPAVYCAARKIKNKYYKKGQKVIVRVADDTDKDLLPNCFWEEAAKNDPEAAQGSMIHGGSLETAKMLDTHPELVRKEKYPLKLEKYQREDVYFMEEVSATGTGGDPSKATVKAGSLLWSYLISNLAKYLKELSE